MNQSSSASSAPARRLLPVALGLLLVGVAAAFWLLSDWVIAPIDATPARPGSPDVASPVSAARAADAPAEVAGATAVRDVVVTDLPHPATDGRVRIRVVRDGDTPAAGATVVTMAPGFAFDKLAPDLERRLQRARGIWDRLEVVGVPTTADRDGIARVPRPTQWQEALGRSHGLFGWCRLEGPEPEGGFLLRLVADSTLQVRVQAANGSPVADLPVGLSTTYQQPGAASGDAEVFAVATTDAAGVAMVNHLQLLRTDDSGAVAQRARIVPFAPGLTDGGVGIDLSSPPPDGIDLVLPPVGSLRVLLRDRDGSPLSGDNLRLDDLASPGPTFFATAVDGVARYAVVGLGRQFHAQSRIDARSLDGAGPGPVRAGEEAALVLQLPATGVSLRGRAVDADGRALASGSLGIDGAAVTLSASDQVRTDHEGRFLLLLDATAVGASLDAILRWQPPSTSSVRFLGEQARLDGVPLVAGTTQLGDVVFRRAPVLAVGRVFGVDPLPSLHATVARQSRSGAWNWAMDIAVDLRADGAFEVLGQIAPGESARHLLQFTAEGCAPVAPLEFVGGERDLRIELRREAKFEARVLVHASVLQHPEVLVFETLSPGTSQWAPQEAEVDADALVLRLAGLPAGTSSFRARLLGDPESLVTFEDLPLRGGETLRDARLQAIDLRSVHAVRLRLVDERGEARDVGGHWVPTRPDRVGDVGAGIGHGVTWVGCRDTFDVLLFGEGLRPTRARGPVRDLDVRIDAELAIALHIEGLPQPPAGCAFGVVVKSLSRGVVGEFAAEADFALDRQYRCAADGKVPLRIAEPGLFELRVIVQRVGDATRRADVSVTQTRFLADGQQQLAVTAEAVARALAELGLGR